MICRFSELPSSCSGIASTLIMRIEWGHTELKKTNMGLFDQWTRLWFDYKILCIVDVRWFMISVMIFLWDELIYYNSPAKDRNIYYLHMYKYHLSTCLLSSVYSCACVCEHSVCGWALWSYFSKVLPLIRGISLCVHYTECCYFPPYSMSSKVLREATSEVYMWIFMCTDIHTNTHKAEWGPLSLLLIIQHIYSFELYPLCRHKHMIIAYSKPSILSFPPARL